MGGSWWGTTTSAAPDPDAPLGLTNAEIFALPQLRFQLAGVVAAHVVAYAIFSRWTSGPFARKPYLMARYVPFVGVFAFQSAYGLALWLGDADLAAMDRVWGAHGGATVITTSMLAIQLYDVPISFGAPELSHATFLVHHAVVACLAYFGLRYRAFNYYASRVGPRPSRARAPPPFFFSRETRRAAPGTSSGRSSSRRPSSRSSRPCATSQSSRSGSP